MKGVIKVILKVNLGDEDYKCMIMCKNSNFQVQLIRNKNKTHRHVHSHTYTKLTAHRECVPLRVSTAGIILFKNCAFGDYPPTTCKI